MKRLLFLCTMLSLLAGCSNDFEDTTQTPVGGTTESGLPTVISASVTEPEEEEVEEEVEEKVEEGSRTHVVRDQFVFWDNGDAIAYFAGVTKAKYTYNGASSVLDASFDLTEESRISRIMNTNAVYPYDAAISCTFNGSVDQLTVNYPAEQTYANNSFGKGANLMVYMGNNPEVKDANLNFRNACGYFTIKLYSSKLKPAAIKSIKLTALGGEKIAGPATIVAGSNGIPQITMSNEGTSEVTLNCGNSGKVISNDAEHPTEFWFALPPTTFEQGVRIEVVDVEGTTYVKKTSNKIVVERNRIKPMAAFKFAYPTDNQLWYTRHSDSRELLGFYDTMENLFDAEYAKHYYDEDNNLFVIEFKEPLKVIKEKAFLSYGLHKDESRDIATITLPEQLTTIEEEAFYDSGITEFVVPGSVTYIGEDCFVVCSKLRSVIFYPSPDNTPLEIAITPSLGNDQGPFAYNGAVSLSYIYVNRDIFLTKGGEPFTPDNDDEGIFSCSSAAPVGTLVIGEQLPEIYPYMFSGCSIDNFEIPAHITKIGDGAFFGCKKLTTITIPSTVQSIGVDAFFNTTSLRTVIIEDSNEPLQLGHSLSFTGEDRGTFYYSPLAEIYLGRDIDYRDEDGALFNPNWWDEGVFATEHYDNEDLKTNVTISNNVTTILESMFSGVRMETVTIPASVTEIEDDAFEYCYVLKKVRCESTTPPTLGTGVFNACNELDNIYVPASAVASYKNATNWSDYASSIVGY
ncbi:MAG: leucine-rich repeat domain-containing protein [Tidjanibacter sp.]|nr:leucine-rich repeat domain-containing protein [Tidjanibacter sp.]MBQ6604376.1 leucine-rich repeat domain-containing protein [Tidjanibacter sp.]MBQ6604431.1 leucine-rich repeat domain-containing protein [Tidjanibacter sp.]